MPTLFEKYTGKILESVGCLLLSINGIAFKNFLEIIKKGYYIKYAVLTGGDKDTNTKEVIIYKDYIEVIFNVVFSFKE